MRKWIVTWLCANVIFFVFLLPSFFFLVDGRNYIFSDFLFHDDAIYVSKSLFSVPDYVRSNPILFHVIGFVGYMNSIPVFKILTALWSALVTGLIAVVFFWISGRLILSGLTALAAVSYPISMDQAFFVSGSHPTFGTIFATLALAAFFIGWVGSDRRFIVGSAIAGVSGLMAALSSPTMILMTTAPAIWLAIAAMLQWRGSRRLVIGLSMFLVPLAVHLWHGFGEYHYSGVKGWTEYSLQNIFGRLQDSLDLIFYKNWETAAGWLIGVYLVALIVILALVIHTGWKGGVVKARREPRWHLEVRDLVLFLILAVVGAALSFGPASITTSLLPRYVVGPFLLAAFGMGAVMVWALQRASAPVGGAVVLALVGLSAVHLVHRGEVRDARFAAYLDAHNKIRAMVEAEANQWPERGQVVIILPAGLASPTAGFNHWSTWYLRALTGSKELIGLIGSGASLNQRPFVEAYADHGPEYWSMRGDRSARIPMRGLEEGRPLFAYSSEDRDDPLASTPIAFVSTRGVALFARGDLPNLARAEWERASCGDRPLRSNSVVWAVESDDAPNLHAPPPEAGTGQAMAFDGTHYEIRTIDVPRGQWFELAFTLSSAQKMETISYSETTPFMPVLSDVIAIYQTPEGFRLSSRQANKNWNIFDEGAGVRIELQGISGCYMVLSANNNILGVLDPPSPSGTWIFGKGFMQRYWSGEVALKIWPGH